MTISLQSKPHRTISTLNPATTEPYIPRMAIKEPQAPVVGDKGLQAGALGLVGNVVIGLAAVAPAYSLAATLGFVVLAVGAQAPSCSSSRSSRCCSSPSPTAS